MTGRAATGEAGAATDRAGPGTAAGPPPPPGEFDLDDPGFQTDPWPVYEWYRQHAPVHWSEPLRSYVLVGYDHVRRALTSGDFSVYHPFRVSRRAFGPSMLDSTGRAHTGPRRCAGTALRPRPVSQLVEQVVRPYVVEELTDAVRSGTDLLADRLARRLPMRVVCRLLGLPDSDAGWLHDMMRPLVRYVDHAPVPLAEVTGRRDELRAYFRGRLREGVDDGLLTALAEDPEVTDADVVNNSILFLAAGTETTAGAITFLLARLATRDGLLPELRDDRARVPAVVAETLRHEPPLHLTLRFATRDLEIAGVRLAQGAPVQVCLASANRDPAVYERPADWDPERRPRTPMSFGVGPHVCLGMGLAQAELEVITETVLDHLAVLTVRAPLPAARGRAFRAVPGVSFDYRSRSEAV